MEPCGRSSSESFRKISPVTSFTVSNTPSRNSFCVSSPRSIRASSASQPEVREAGRRRGRHHIGGNRRRLFGQLHRRLPRRIRKCLLAAAEHVRRPVLCPSVQLLRLLLRHGFLRGRRLRPGVLRHLHRGRECHRQSRLSHAVELLEQPLLLESRFLFRKLLLALLGMELGLQLGMELGMGPELGMVSGLVASGMA